MPFPPLFLRLTPPLEAGTKPIVYNLIVKFFVILLYFVVNPVQRTYIRGFGALP